MLTIFNRKELTVTMDMKRQADIRTILSANDIDYDIKTTNLQSASTLGRNRAHTGSMGVNQDYSCEYKIFVGKDDYEKAKGLI